MIITWQTTGLVLAFALLLVPVSYCTLQLETKAIEARSECLAKLMETNPGYIPNDQRACNI